MSDALERFKPLDDWTRDDHLEVAVEYDLIPTNPAAGRRRRLKADRPQRAYLDSAGQISALLDAAGALDAEARPDRSHVARRPLVATRLFAGLRIGELLELRWRDVDLAPGWLDHRSISKDRCGDSKDQDPSGPAGRPGGPQGAGAPRNPGGFVFGTSEGKRQSAS
jgi:integrase